jgi:hypothetical protein
MVRETIAAWHIIHAAEVGEEILEGGEMGQEVADLHAPLIIFARSPTQDAVIRAELSIWRLKRVRKINLADDGLMVRTFQAKGIWSLAPIFCFCKNK